MKKYFRFAAVLLLALVPAAAIAGCEENSIPSESTEITSAETEATVPAEAVLTKDGTFMCRIVRSIDASETELAAALSFKKTLSTIYPDATIEITDDFSKDGTYDSESYEILFGLTSYPETQTVLDNTGYGDAAVQAVGHKLVVVSRSSLGYTTLNNEFFVKLSNMSDKANVTFGENDSIKLTINDSLNTIPVIKGINPDNTVSSGDKAYQLYFRKASADTLASYINQLKDSGFELKADRTVGNNRFTSFIGNGTSVTAYYTDTNSTLRIIAEPDENYYVSSNEYTTVTTPLLTMIGRKYTSGNTYLGCDADSGLMCFMIRLSDGRFLVIDGGVSDGTQQSYAGAMYAKMKEQAPDPNNIVIAAWIFTHSHSDHVGGFKSFAQAYHSVVKIESILYNFPSDADFKSSCDEAISSYQAFKGAITQYYSKTPVYKIHTGQQYNIADALIEVYYTHEDYVTQNRTMADTTNWNITSAIFSVDIAGERIMFLGDAQEVPNNLTAQIYGSYLKSDIVQVAHHGGIGGTNAIYKAVDAEIALFTTSDALLSVYIEKWSYNYYLVNSLNLKEYFNSATRITTFKLPYHAKASGFVTTTDN